MKSYPFDALQIGTDSSGNPIYDRVYDSADLRRQLQVCFTNGVGATPSDNFQVSANQDLTVTVQPGYGIVNGCIFQEDEEQTLQLEANNNSVARHDYVVIRFDNRSNHRDVTLQVLKGPSGVESLPPDIETYDDIYDLVLADVQVDPGVTAISQSKIEDMRLDNSLCGIMSAVGEVDTSTIFNQYQAALDEYLKLVDAAMNETLAGNLQNQIDQKLGPDKLANNLETYSEGYALDARQGVELAKNYVLDEGVGDDLYWYHRKWSNGKYECWYTFPITTAVDGTMGALFASDKITFDELPFPIPFIKTPFCQISVDGTGGYGGFWFSSNEATRTTPPKGYILRPTKCNERSFEINIYAYGRWK